MIFKNIKSESVVVEFVGKSLILCILSNFIEFRRFYSMQSENFVSWTKKKKQEIFMKLVSDGRSCSKWRSSLLNKSSKHNIVQKFRNECVPTSQCTPYYDEFDILNSILCTFSVHVCRMILTYCTINHLLR